MKLKMYVIFDAKVGSFRQPFFMLNRGHAIRGFEELCNDRKTEFYKYPSDFTLFEIGEYDDTAGSFDLSEAKVPLGTALEFKKSDPEMDFDMEVIRDIVDHEIKLILSNYDAAQVGKLSVVRQNLSGAPVEVNE